MYPKPKWRISLLLWVPFYVWILAGCTSGSTNPINNLSPSPSEIKPPVKSPLPSTETPAAQPVQNSTLAAPLTDTPRLSPTLFSTSVKTLAASLTNTPRPSPTLFNTPVKTLVVLPLSGAMLTRDDYLASDIGSLRFLSPSDVYGTFFKDGRATITDVSTELDPICLIDCTKQVWATPSEEVTGFGGALVTLNSKVMIAMLRSKDDEEARNAARNIYSEFVPFDTEYGESEYKLVNAPIANTRIGIATENSRLAVILTTSIGPITLWVVSNPAPLSDFAAYEIDVAVFFANMQIRKLKGAGIIP